MASNQFDLLKQKRFLPFFITQSLGAFNDNIYKNALFILFTYQMANQSSEQTSMFTNIAAMIFILPFFLFSATSGQLAEKFEKSAMIRKIKLLEIVIMILAGIGFYFNNTYFLLFVLFLMGFQSSLFGPIKYSILPQHLKPNELIGGNGLVETGTFLAILLGTMLGGAIMSMDKYGSMITSAVIFSIAIIGYWTSRSIPLTPPIQPNIKINFNIFTETYRSFQFMKEERSVFLSVLGISWFWFFGATILVQMSGYTKFTLGGQAEVATLLLTFFSLGIGIGSLLCEKLSGNKVEIGLVPFGAIGMTIFTVDLFLANNATGMEPTIGISEFISDSQNWRVLIDASLIGIFGGFFIVPLYAMIQQRCKKEHLSRVIAGNNILNALFMVLSAIMAMTLIKFKFTIPELLLIIAILNACVSIYIFSLVPEFFMRFLVWIFINLFYRIKLNGIQNIKNHGAKVLVCNHVSFMDALIILGTCPRPVRFVMDHRIFKIPVLSFIFRTAGAIPIAPAHEDPRILEQAFEQVSNYLDQGEIVCIFPEGKLTQNGEMNRFKPGIENIIKRTPVEVIPMALQGLWGSFFSRKDGPAMGNIPRRFWSKIGVVIGEEVSASDVSVETLFSQVKRLRGGNA